MHRNTVKNKIELIKSLLHIDIDNTDYFLGLTTSHLMIEYFTNYMGGDIMTDTDNMR